MASHLANAGIGTRAVHVGDPPAVPGSPVSNPVVHSSTFYNAPDGTGPIWYARYGNGPNTLALQERIASLEGADACVVTGSGTAAMACTLLALLESGDHVVAAGALYGGTRILLDRELSRLGISTTYADFSTDDWADALRAETRAVLVEMPSNPLLRVVDLPRVAERVRRHGARLLVDSTFATPVNLRPLEHGADLVIHSATKYLGGHSDVTAGAVAGPADLLMEVQARAASWGPMLDPHAAWLTERGVKTLALRMERHNRNGSEIATWCERRPGVERVLYPGLSSHPDHALAARLLDGFGGVMTLQLSGGGDAASRFVHALRLAKVAPSLGGVETLVSEPRYTSHSRLSPEERTQDGIPDGTVRFSLGIEDAADLIADIEQALRAVDGQ